MYRVRVDYNYNIADFTKGSDFYFDSLIEATDFIETCFESNASREVVEIKYLKDE